MLLFIFQPSGFSAEAEEGCIQIAEAYRSDSLTRLFRLEKYYMTAAWHYRKSQITVYNPLWEANLKRKDRFSKDKKAEGEVLFNRYRHLADMDEALAARSAKKAMREFEKLEKIKPAGIRCGRAPVNADVEPSQTSFDNCMSLWAHEWDQKIAALKKDLKEFQLWEGKISMAAEKTLEETPSDHEKIVDRFREYFQEIDLKVNTSFVESARILREMLELKWDVEDCCRLCAGDKTIYVDPVFGKVKLDPIGVRGVDDKTYKKSSLLEAFKDMESNPEDKEKQES